MLQRIAIQNGIHVIQFPGAAKQVLTPQKQPCFHVMPWFHVKYNYFSLRRRPSKIILFQRVETCLKLFQNYLAGLLQLMMKMMMKVAILACVEKVET